MNTFFQGLKFGFAQGMMNNVFGMFSPFGFGSFGFSSFGFSPFGFSPFNIGMNFGMSIFSIPMMGFNYMPAPSVYTYAPGMSANSFIIPGMVTLTPETTAEFTDTFVPSAGYNPFPAAENKDEEDESLTEEERDKLEEAKEIQEILDLQKKWAGKKDIAKNAEITPQFCDKVVDISKRLRCKPDDLMAVMYNECRFNPTKPNPFGNVGLIQFGEAALKDIGITKEQLLNMNSLEQLDYVEKYIKMGKERKFSPDKVLDLGTLAALVFRPGYADKEILAKKGEDAYKNNPQYDTNNDKKIKKSELADWIRKFQ